MNTSVRRQAQTFGAISAVTGTASTPPKAKFAIEFISQTVKFSSRPYNIII
jgi:hypothetical protein